MTYSRRFAILLIAAAVVLLCGASVTLAHNAVPGQAVVRIGNGSGASHAFSGAGVQVVDSIPELRLYLVEYPSQVPFNDKRRDLLGQGGVQLVEPNYRMDMLETFQMSISFPDENVPVYLSGEEPVSYYEQPSVYSIGLDSAQLISTGAGITIAVIDNGVDLTHPLFSNIPDSMTHDFVDKDNDVTESDGTLRGHGTFVAGLVRLAAPDSRLAVIRAFDGEGMSNSFTVSQAINWAVQRNADVINMSFGTLTNSQVLQQACQRAVEMGVVLVASVGNSSSVNKPVYPAAYPGVIAVASIGPDERIASFSNSFDGVDVCAPGVNLYSALPAPYEWGTWSGTSFSAPLVAAICALDLAQVQMSALETEAHIQATAVSNLLWGSITPPDPYYGYGRVDAFNSLLMLTLGDLNNSGGLDLGDLGIAGAIVAGGELPTNTIIRKADMNGDGVVNQTDIDILAQRFFQSGGSH